jgi:hypothetical protein
MALTDNSEKVRQDIQRRLAAGLNRGNEFLINEARGEAPVKSGDLRDGTEIINEADGSNLTAVGASRMPYAATVNRGDSQRDAQPFWTNSWIRLKDGFGRFFTNG